MFMNKTLVANLEDKRIFLISDNNISFYIGIPNDTKVTIVLNLLDNTNSINSSNNMEELTNNIKSIYNKINFKDSSVVTPVMDNNILEQVKLNNNAQIFNYLDKVMGYLINHAYSILKENGKEVNNSIKLNNNRSYEAFNDWFVKKYNGRVSLVNYLNAPVNRFDEEEKNDIKDNVNLEMDTKVADSILENTQSLDNVQENKVYHDEAREPGFVSYVLLGVIVAVVSLAILYKLL